MESKKLNRRNFIQNSAFATMGLYTSPFWTKSLLASPAPKPYLARILGYLIPFVVEGIDILYDMYQDNSQPDVIVNQSIVNIYNNSYDISEGYRAHYTNAVKPYLDTAKLNGVGYYDDDDQVRSVMNDYSSKASTPLHSIRNVKHFNRNTWEQYCDISDLVISRGDSRVYVTPRDQRPAHLKGTFWIEDRFAYLIYNPTYYCKGLPTENRQLHFVDDNLGRKIKEKTGKITSTRQFYTQQWCYWGSNCNGAEADYHTIYWGHDQAIKEYYGLGVIKGCGDPTIHCHGTEDSVKKNINR